MELWNYVHQTIGTHVYIFLGIILLAVMIACGFIAWHKQRKRERDENKELELLKSQNGSSDIPAGGAV